MLKTKQYFFIILPVIFLMLNGCKKTPDPVPTTFKILSVNPTSAYIGDRINIEIEGVASINSSKIYFNDTLATEYFVEIVNSKGYINVKVPYATSGEIKVVINGKTYIATSNFTILPLPDPVISEVSPTSAKVGDQVTIKGKNFSYHHTNSTSLFIGDVKVEEFSIGEKIIFIVPENAKTAKITLSVNGKIGTSKEELIIN